jgi:hypothetical protein
MTITNASSALQPAYLRHDLMLEMGRLEEVIEDARHHPPVEDPRRLALREAQFASAREALLRLLV